MQKQLLLIFFLTTFCFAHAQEHARIFFADKADVANSIANPQTILTQKAIDRKQKFSIPIDESDVPVNENYLTNLKSQPGITVKSKSKWFNLAHVIGSQTDIQALSSLPFVSRIEFADRNLNPPPKTQQPTNFQDKTEILVNFNYGASANQVQMLNVHLLHQQDFTGEGVTIAVMDGGFPGVGTLAAFDRMRAAGKLLGGFDFVSRTPDFLAFTGNEHGTNVLSTMAAFIDGQLIGTAPDASYYLFRTEDVASETPVEESYWVEAAERADSLGVDVINTSLGYSIFDDTRYNYSPSEMDGQTAFITKGSDIAFDKGMIVVNSAGNSGNDSTWRIVTAPADGFKVLAIGAVDASGNVASFSSRGPSADGRVKPDVMAKGQGALVVNTSNAVISTNGTSFSSPIMAGSVASLWQALPDKSNIEIVNIIKESSSIFSSPDNDLGFGIPDFSAALNGTLSVTDFNPVQIKVFPNPVRQFLTIRLDGNFQKSIFHLYDLLGRNVKTVVLNENISNIDLSELPSGIFLGKIESDVTQTIKIIKQ